MKKQDSLIYITTPNWLLATIVFLAGGVLLTPVAWSIIDNINLWPALLILLPIYLISIICIVSYRVAIYREKVAVLRVLGNENINIKDIISVNMRTVYRGRGGISNVCEIYDNSGYCISINATYIGENSIKELIKVLCEQSDNIVLSGRWVNDD